MTYLNGGVFQSAGDWIHGKRCLASSELIFVTSGCVELEEDGVPYSLHKGDVLILEKGKCHAGTAPTRDVGFYWFHFDGEMPVKTVHADDARLPLLIRELFHYENTPEYPRDTLDCMLRLIAAELGVIASQQKDETLIGEVTEWIRINSDRRITVAMLSERFKYNADYLSRRIKARYGISLEKYINGRRRDFIKHTLLSSQNNISEVAALCGFPSYAAFLKYFVYHEKISPSEYRAVNTGIHMNKH